MELKKKIQLKMRPKIIDLRKADGYAITDADLVVEQLRKDRKYTPDLMYRGFDGRRLEIMLQYGTDTPTSDEIYCGNEEELRNGGIEETECALAYALRHPVPALAIYDSSLLDRGQEKDRVFMDPSKKLEALVAVYLLKA
ncbi:hypothetical protein HY495_02915 [Candidatus Woesearchaeota archaeon]|nr:hypothetical protein [Candidatus Woesearchaeota archaeon]